MPTLPPVLETVVVPDLFAFCSPDCLANRVIVPVASPTRESIWNPILPVPDLIVAHQVFLI